MSPVSEFKEMPETLTARENSRHAINLKLILE